MTIYKWRGRTRQGSIATGEMEAPNSEAVVARLRSSQIIASSIKIKSELFQGFSDFGQKVSQKEIVIFTRQFAAMIDAGLPLIECLDIVVDQLEHKAFRRVLTDVKRSVENGSTLAGALAKHPKVFDRLFVALIAAGEVGGILDTILHRLGAYIEKSLNLKKKVKGAMVYPATVLSIAAAVVLLMLIFVIPGFQSMFEGVGGELPAPTQFVMDLSAFITSHWFLLLAIVSGFVVGAKAILNTENGREMRDRALLRLPIFGQLIRKVAIAKFTRTLSTIVTSGVPIMDGLEICAKTAGNKKVEAAILESRKRIAEGQTLSEPLLQSGVFPRMVCRMITVGEATGALDVMLAKIADFYEDEVDNTVGALTTMLEPIMLVVLGGIVGGLLITMYLPIFGFIDVFK